MRTQHRFCAIPAKDTELGPNHEETSDKQKLRDTLQKKWSVVFKNVKITKNKERLRNYSRLKETKKTRKLNATGDPGLDPFVIKDIHCWGIWRNLNGVFGLDGSDASVLTSCVEWLYCGYKGECTSLQENTPKHSGVTGHHVDSLLSNDSGKKHIDTILATFL